MFRTSISTSSQFWLFDLLVFVRDFLHAFNVEISLQSIYPILWNSSETVTVWTLDVAGAGLPLLSVPLIETVRTEGVVACQELGLVLVVIIGLCTDSTIQQLRWIFCCRCHVTLSDCETEIQTKVWLLPIGLNEMLPGGPILICFMSL